MSHCDRSVTAGVCAVFRILALFVLFASAGNPAPARAEDPVYVASTLWSSAQAVGIVDDVAIVLCTAGMATFDVADPSEPRLLERLTRFDAPGGYADIEIVGDRAYVASIPDGLRVYDVSKPAHPVHLSSVPLPGAPYGFARVDNLLYVACGYTGGLQIVDLSDPDAPSVLGGCLTGGSCFAVEVVGAHAYCTEGIEGLSIIDVSDPARPTLVTIVPGIPYPPYAIAAGGGFLYTLGGSGEKSDWDPSGLTVLDLADPEAPQVRGVYTSSEGANRLALRGDLAYLANADGSVTTVDVGDPDAPAGVFETETGGYSLDITLHGNRAYVPSSSGTLAILSLEPPEAPVLLGRWWESGAVTDVRLRGGIAFTLDSRYGLHVVDLQTPAGPVILADLPLPGVPRAIAISGTFAYVAADSAGVYAIDIANPKHPQIVGHLAQYAVAIATDGRYLYVVARNQGMRVIDALEPGSLELVAICPVPGWPSAVSVAGEFACVTNGTDLYVIDLADPRAPEIRGRYDPAEHAHQVTFDGAWAYVCAGNNGVLVIDVSDPDAPVYVTDLRFDGNTWGSSLQDQRLYVATNALEVVDVTDPRHPQVVGQNPMGLGLRVAVEGDLACTASGDHLGVFLLGAASSVDEPSAPPPPATPAWPAAAPGGTGVSLCFENPVRGPAEIRLRVDPGSALGGAAAPGEVVLDLLDVTGRLIDRIHRGPMAAGEVRLRWDPQDRPAGIYYLRVATPAGAAARPVAILR